MSKTPQTRLPPQGLVAIVEQLFPSGEAGGVSRPRGSSSARRTEFLLVPNASRPRLVLPAGRPRAQAAALLRFSDALSWRDRAARILGATALRVGGEKVLRHHLSVAAGGHDSIEQHLSAVLGYDVIVSLGVGSIRVNQKPILNVFNGDGESVAFVKVGDNAVTRALVTQEAKALFELGERSWASLRPPQLLHFGTWNDLTLLVVSALPTPALPRLRGRLVPPLSAMTELSHAFAEDDSPLATTAWWEGLVSTAHGLRDAERRTVFVRALTVLRDTYGDQPVQLGAWHGDWTPWNMARLGASVLLWDWERFEKAVPVGLDASHFAVAVAARRGGWTREVLVEALALTKVGADPHVALRGGLYLAAITARYLQSEQGIHGDVIRRQADTALQTLVWWLGQVSAGLPATWGTATQ